MNKESIKEYKPLGENHWFKVAERLYKEAGKVPDRLEIRAAIILEALGLSSGETSALGVNEKGERTDIKKDRVIAEYLTNKPGVLIDKKSGVTSSDFRDIYPNGLPRELEEALDKNTLAIMKVEYSHLDNIRKKFGDTENDLEVDDPVHYFRLPGGVDLFVRGYTHNPDWQENHGFYLRRVNSYAKVISIEGILSSHLGETLDELWGDPKWREGHYSQLMHEAVDEAKFNGLFVEVDARDASALDMDATPSGHFPKLPDLFFIKYFEYLKRESPGLASKIFSVNRLKDLLRRQSTSDDGVITMEKDFYDNSIIHREHPYITNHGETSLGPTYLELGQMMFTDALAAIKLHMIARLMSGGYIPNGPIVDYEGMAHVLSKSFFIRYPGYAMEVVLRTVNELMAGRVKKKGDVSGIYNVFENSDWKAIIKEIVKLPFKKVEDDTKKSIDPGSNQRKLIPQNIDFLKIFNIDLGNVMPSDEDIDKIRQKLG